MIFFLGHQGRQLMMANAAHIMLLHTRNPCNPFLIFIGMILWTNFIIWSSVTRGEKVKWFWVNKSRTVFDCKNSLHHSDLCMKDCDLPFTCEHKKVTRNQLGHLMLDRGEKEERLGKVQGARWQGKLLLREFYVKNVLTWRDSDGSEITLFNFLTGLNKNS